MFVYVRKIWHSPKFLPKFCHKLASTVKMSTLSYIPLKPDEIRLLRLEWNRPLKPPAKCEPSHPAPDARRIIMWLGPGSYETDRALDIYSRVYADAFLAVLKNPRRDYRQAISEKDEKCLEFFSNLDYWTRSWIYQEGTTPNVPREVWCGTRMLDFIEVSIGNNALEVGRYRRVESHFDGKLPLTTSRPSPEIFALLYLAVSRTRTARDLSLVDLFRIAGNLESTLEIDKAYAIDEALQIDYTRPVKDAYRLLAEHILKISGRLDILLLCSVTQGDELNSWVPDFDNLNYCRASRLDWAHVHDAGRIRTHGKRPWFQINAKNGSLCVKGIKVDRVVETCAAMEDWDPLKRPGLRDYNSQPSYAMFHAWTISVARWLRSVNQGRMPESPYVAGGRVSEAADWYLMAESGGSKSRWANWSELALFTESDMKPEECLEMNLTPYNFIIADQHSYQLDTFDFVDIPSGQSRLMTIEYTENKNRNPVDDNGELYYSLNGTNLTFAIRATTHLNDWSGDQYWYRTVVDLTDMGMGQREYGDTQPGVSLTLVITGYDTTDTSHQSISSYAVPTVQTTG
ncbi:hypothetical protein QBC38DRAFT_502299 [Podospora fimiseda]|uniref:Heterokaryon incompatibility domain-containing protein n=1 Tax=Podospora fimiseda TaxID=252190 RepID=A0AAN7GZT0_9PEZI|nr:hypothetical protein QBC38DRAFT_502299 [Podospora fimiseda]